MYVEAEWMSPEDESLDVLPVKGMWSESAELLCTVDSTTNRYFVLNGHWEGRRKGDDFEIIYHAEGHPDNRHLTITDWIEVNLSEFSKTHPSYSEYTSTGVFIKLSED